MTVISGVLLAAGVLLVVVGAVGAVRYPDAFDRLHGSGLVATPGSVLIVLAAVVASPSALFAIKAILTLVVVLVTAPILTHATAEALRVQRFGELRIAPEELADEDARARRTGRATPDLTTHRTPEEPA